MGKQKNQITKTEKLDSRTKWTYSIGAVGRDMAYAMVSMFLITYIQYTMKLTVAQFSAISGIIIVCLIWDAFNDPLMGIIIENSKLKHGKFRPWIITGAICNAIVISLLFSVRLQGWSFVVFFGFGYLLWGMTYTMNDIAYWGMLPSLTSNALERNSLATTMSVFSCVGQFIAAGAIPMLVAGNAVKAYRTVALVIACCFIVFQTLTFLGVKERPRDLQPQNEKLSLRDMFKIFARNDQLIVIGIGTLIFNVASGLLLIFGMNFFYFEFGYTKGGDLIFLFTVMYGLGTLLSQVVFPLLAKQFKRSTLLFATTCFIILGYIGLLLFDYVLPKNTILLNGIGFLIFFSQGLFNMVIVIMLNNTIEYDEYRYKERHDSIISAVRSFAVKLASAVNQGIVTLVLILSGIYAISQKITNLEILAGKGELEKTEVLERAASYIEQTSWKQTFELRLGMVVIPIVAILICYILIHKKYKIDEEMYENMVREINSKQNEGAKKLK
ncbi:glycoside-pentoside-hexuronide (GPH):cation symporter [Anaerosporobacter faecicola]|uniref:glycoside-pentoside-hexuronide (GPH):cation symporter n=1 Tax=Anaerosporobacter faecicola TaxID=2718714 RepID=UPI00143A4A3E|nr:glycoside-pentoside-hexuronide (GPH):cation symporter [Anaerosporobacter faecicola]